MNRPFVLAAGGTGGHLFPAAALAAALAELGRPVHLVTDSRADAFAAQFPDVPVHNLPAGRLGGGPIQTARGLAELAAGGLLARGLLRRLRPAAAIGFGGYPSVPTMLAAVSLGLPTLIHEQNAVLGRANRLLAPHVRCIATGFPDTAGLPPPARGRAVHTGNPVRPAVLALAGAGYSPPEPDGLIELLVLGGSQGAHILAELVPPALALLPAAMRLRLRISQQARPEDLAAVTAAYRAAGVRADIESFFADVPQRLARAHLAVCRAGASTVSELSVAGRPALLIPYPHAAADHQSANARAFAETGGGRVLVQSGLRPEILAGELEPLLADPAALSRMAQSAAAFGRPDAARALAALALAVAPGDAVQERAA